MADDALRPWNWEDPQELEGTIDLFTEDLARVGKLSPELSAAVLDRSHFDRLGLTGIEFAAFKTAHPQALGTDLVSLTAADGTRSGAGQVYHRWLYDFEELRHALTSAGFAEDAIVVRAFREGARPDVADLDQVLRNDETIYIEVTA
ncbi:hypothetical protein ABT297_12915 [Dactylosporangium sp. NPDC000555]|uniref:hypothetical protein n=1 Tax=Dactylosporangium sp. NPDC000555 TaxID=3154260 RepID=UPI0033254B18